MPVAPPGRGTWWVLVPIRLMCDQRWDCSVSLSLPARLPWPNHAPVNQADPEKGPREHRNQREEESWKMSPGSGSSSRQGEQQAGRAAGSRAQLPGHAQLHWVRLCHTVSQDAQLGHPHHAELCLAELCQPRLCQALPCQAGSMQGLVMLHPVCRARASHTQPGHAWLTWPMLCQRLPCAKPCHGTLS